MSESPNVQLSNLHPYDRITFLRGRAIEAYSGIESSLSSLFQSILKTDALAAGTIFYRIVNSRSRNVIMENLLKQRHGTEFKAFWSSISDKIRQLDQSRNEIAHWQHAALINAKGSERGMLFPNNIFAHNQNTPSWTEQRLASFCQECNFVGRLINMLCLFIDGQIGDEHPERRTWTEIFHSPIEYPPPSTHPLHQIVQEYTIQLRSSPA